MSTRQWQVDVPELFPHRLSDWLGGKSKLVDFIIAFVEELDLVALGLDKESCTRGAPSYDRRMLLALWLFGLLNGVKSCRKLEEACRLRVDFIYLAGRQVPDHSTLWSFFHDHRAGMKQLLKVLVKTLRNLNLVDGATILVDGTSIEAAGSRRKILTKEQAMKQLARLEAEASRCVDQVEEGAEAETELCPVAQDRAHLAAQIRRALEEATNVDEKKPADKMCITDPESRAMRRKDGSYGPSYNLQVSTDVGGMIVAVEAVREACDSHQLARQVENSAEMLGVVPKRVIADSGYNTADELARLEELKVEAFVPEQLNRANDPDKPYSACYFRYDEKRDVMICPEGKEMTQWSSHKKKKGKSRTSEHRRYRCAHCLGCPAWGICTSNPKGRIIHRQKNQAAKARTAERTKTELGNQMLKCRKRIERSFSTIKSRLGLGRIRLWGQRNATDWMTLVAIAIDIETAFKRIAGPPERAPGLLKKTTSAAMAEWKADTKSQGPGDGASCAPRFWPTVQAFLASLLPTCPHLDAATSRGA